MKYKIHRLIQWTKTKRYVLAEITYINDADKNSKTYGKEEIKAFGIFKSAGLIAISASNGESGKKYFDGNYINVKMFNRNTSSFDGRYGIYDLQKGIVLISNSPIIVTNNGFIVDEQKVDKNDIIL